MKLTVNRLLAMEKSLRERLSQLKSLELTSARVTIWDEPNKREEPTYEIKNVDKKVVDINKALFEISHSIKESNAKTLVDVGVDYNALVSGIE